MSETKRLADQIRRAFEGDAWHGDSLLEILADVDAPTAAARPLPNAHSIWELVLHIAAWDDAVRRRAVTGKAVSLTGAENFPALKDTSAPQWRRAVKHLKQAHADLVKAVAGFPDSRLMEQVPGKKESYHNFFYMFSGIVQHELYHGGQIALLKKAGRQ